MLTLLNLMFLSITSFSELPTSKKTNKKSKNIGCASSEFTPSLSVTKELEGEGNLHWTPDMQLALARAAHEYKPFLETRDINGKSKDFKWGEVMSHLKNLPAFEHVKHHKVLGSFSVLRKYFCY